ncbi:MAG: NAD-dependent deacetylase [Bacteroidetes bacterium]|nr:MAG: NAD-dependent deacetylase [Bacteroidota bacterium]
MKKKIVVFTGAGVSAESGIKTFRDSGGLWEEYDVRDVATPEAWAKNPGLVLRFYNERRNQVIDAKPNAAHHAIASLQKKFDVHVVTQNIDDLHERAGSKNVLHLHGEILKARSSVDPALIYPMKNREIKIGDKCEKGSQLRPHIVWFGEAVPNYELGINICHEAELLIIIGTSLNVYPAAGIVHYAKPEVRKFLIDPQDIPHGSIENLTSIKEKAGTGMQQLAERILSGEIVL